MNRVLGAALALITGLLWTRLTNAASFDCSKAHTQVEMKICATPSLSKLDDELARQYRLALEKAKNSSGWRFLLPWQEKRWLKRRDQCTSTACIKKRYQDRIAQLKQHDAYALVMSRNQALCHTMLRLYNGDMKKYGKIDYKQHTMFSRIAWQNAGQVPGGRKAIFDIDNNGADNLVIKMDLPLYNSHQDTIYAFDDIDHAELSLSKKWTSLRPIIKKAPIKLDVKSYKLRFVPLSIEKYIIRRMRKEITPPVNAGYLGVYVGRPFIHLHALIYENRSYINISGFNHQWIVLAKLIKTNKLKDICYFYNPYAGL